jgi:hypothetical protein
MFFSAGTDSPVRAASSIRRLLLSSSRRSAGTLSPDASRTTSPGTSSAAASAFLDEADDRVEHDHAEHDRPVEGLAEHDRQRGRSEEDPYQRVVDLPPQQRPDRVALAPGQQVRAVAFEPGLGFVRGQALPGGAERGEHRVGCQGVSVASAAVRGEIVVFLTGSFKAVTARRRPFG